MARLKDFVIPFPPLAEQRRIVARVDALMALCDALEQRQAQRGEERKRLLAALVGGLLSARDAGEAADAWARLSASFDLVLDAPEDVAPLRQAVLQLAVQGRLVEQDPADEPASALLERIREEKARLVKEGQLKREETPRANRDTDTLTEMPTGWEISRLDDLFVLLRNGIAEAPSGSSGTPILRISALRPNSVNLDEVRFLPGPIEAYSDYVLQEDDLLFTRYSGKRDYVGICGVVPALPSHIVYPDKLIRGKLVESLVVPKYVALAANVGISRAYIEQFLKTTAGQVGVAGRDLKLMPVPLPPLAEQRRIVARVEQLMALCDALEARLREGRAAAERLAEALCAAVMAGQAVEQHDTASTWAPAEEAAILELPARMPRLAPAAATLDDYAVLVARTVQRHQGTRHASSLGHVKLEKIAHLAEGWGGVELGRRPQRKPRGPVDFELLEQVIARGRELDAFDAPQRESAEWGYKFVALPRLDDLAARLGDTFGARAARLEQLLDLMLPLSTRQAEAVATLYAVWNDMLRAGQQPDDEQIFAAFWIFHPKKKRFKQETLERWLSWMRKHGIVPDGSAKPTLPASQRDEALAPIDFAAAAQQRRPARRAAETPSAYDAGDDYPRAAALLAERGALTNGELQAALGLDGSAARALLKQLVAEGLATVEGQKRGTRYLWRG